MVVEPKQGAGKRTSMVTASALMCLRMAWCACDQTSHHSVPPSTA